MNAINLKREIRSINLIYDYHIGMVEIVLDMLSEFEPTDNPTDKPATQCNKMRIIRDQLLTSFEKIEMVGKSLRKFLKVAKQELKEKEEGKEEVKREVGGSEGIAAEGDEGGEGGGWGVKSPDTKSGLEDFDTMNVLKLKREIRKIDLIYDYHVGMVEIVFNMLSEFQHTEKPSTLCNKTRILNDLLHTSLGEVDMVGRRLKKYLHVAIQGGEVNEQMGVGGGSGVGARAADWATDTEGVAEEGEGGGVSMNLRMRSPDIKGGWEEFHTTGLHDVKKIRKNLFGYI